MEKYKDFFTPVAILAAGVMVSFSVLTVGGVDIFKQGLRAQAGAGSEAEKEQVKLDPELYRKLAKEMGLNISQFDNCVERRTYKDKVENDFQEGVRLGINGTPGSFVNSQAVRGAIPYEQLKSIIDSELASGNTALADGLNITEKDHIKGNANAKITLVEFSDFQCPFCRRFHPTAQQALDAYQGNVRWVYKHFPLDSIHPEARPAAEASECVAEQKGSEGFWQFADILFELQGS